MKTINFSGGTIRYYENEKELPIHRYVDFQKYLAQDMGFGSTMSDVDKHFRMMDRNMVAGKYNEAKQIRDNLHMNLYMMFEKINILSLSLGCLIHSINNEVIYDTTEANLLRMSERLGKMGMTQKEVEKITTEVKKKLTVI